MVQAQCLQASQSAELRNEGGKLVVATAQGVCTGTKRGGGQMVTSIKAKDGERENDFIVTERECYHICTCN